MIEKVKKENLDKVLLYLSIFEQEEFLFNKERSLVNKEGKIIQICGISYRNEVSSFFDEIYSSGVIVNFDWTEWQEVGFSYYENPEKINNADLITIRKILTMHIRKERFCEGHMLRLLKEGFINLLLKRMKEIRQEMP